MLSRSILQLCETPCRSDGGAYVVLSIEYIVGPPPQLNPICLPEEVIGLLTTTDVRPCPASVLRCRPQSCKIRNGDEYRECLCNSKQSTRLLFIYFVGPKVMQAKKWPHGRGLHASRTRCFRCSYAGSWRQPAYWISDVHFPVIGACGISQPSAFRAASVRYKFPGDRGTRRVRRVQPGGKERRGLFAATMRGENKRHRGGDEEIGATDNHRRGAGSGDPSFRRHSALALLNTRSAGGVSRRRRARGFPACGDASAWADPCAWFDGRPSHVDHRLCAAYHQHPTTAPAIRHGQTGRGYGCTLQVASESSLEAVALFQASTYIAQGLPPDLHLFLAPVCTPGGRFCFNASRGGRNAKH